MSTNLESWERVAARYHPDADVALDSVEYGPDGPTERELRLLGDLAGKRILELGCGTGQASLCFAQQGATAIAVDSSEAQLNFARTVAEREDLRVEFHQTDLADLAFLRADSIDMVFSAYALGEVEDLGRVFRQVHRVLRHHAPFVFSYEHPFALCTTRDEPSTPGALPLGSSVLTRSYFDDNAITVSRDGEPVVLQPRSIGEVFTDLGRAGFRVDVIAEPLPVGAETQPMIPSTIVWRARKEGV